MRLSMDELRSLHETLAADERVAAFYQRFPRNLWWDRGNRQCSTTIIREAVDTEELLHRMQRTDLFGINTDTDLKVAAIEWLVNKYESCGISVDSLPAGIEESAHSAPGISIDRAGRRLSIDFLRTLWWRCTICFVFRSQLAWHMMGPMLQLSASSIRSYPRYWRSAQPPHSG